MPGGQPFVCYVLWFLLGRRLTLRWRADLGVAHLPELRASHHLDPLREVRHLARAQLCRAALLEIGALVRFVDLTLLELLLQRILVNSLSTKFVYNVPQDGGLGGILPKLIGGGLGCADERECQKRGAHAPRRSRVVMGGTFCDLRLNRGVEVRDHDERDLSSS